DEARERAERFGGGGHVDVGLDVVQPADRVLDVVAAERLVGLAGDDLASQLPSPSLERLHDVLEVDDYRVGRETGAVPIFVLGVLRHRGALVLSDVAEAEREFSFRAKPLRAYLVGADA